MDEWQPNLKVQAWRSKQCTWCTDQIRGESFTVTFPEKDQAFFHVECLYRYREMMNPSATS